jgi:phage FluMu protein Com
VFLTKCTTSTGKRRIYPWHGCPIFKELNFTYMREEKSYYEIKRERKLRDTGNQMRFFFSSFQTWSVTILARASLINEGKELR